MTEAAGGSNTGGLEGGPRMPRAIPEQIVAAVTALAESLASWCEEGRDGRLEQHEEAVLDRGRQGLGRAGGGGGGGAGVGRGWCRRCGRAAGVPGGAGSMAGVRAEGAAPPGAVPAGADAVWAGDDR